MLKHNRSVLINTSITNLYSFYLQISTYSWMYCLVCLLDVSMLLRSPLGSVCNLVTGAVFNQVGCFTLCTAGLGNGARNNQRVNSAAWCGWTRSEKNPKVNNLTCNFKGGIYPLNWQFCVKCVLQETKKKI